MSNISSRPHIRAKKMDAWKQAAPLSGYLQWREMQLFMNMQMLGVLHIMHISVLPSSTATQLKMLKCEDTIKAFADNDPLHDADVKFFLDGTFRVHPNSSFLSSETEVSTASRATLQEKATSNVRNEFKPRDGDNKPIILLIGSDLHISIAILYNTNPVFDDGGPAKHTKVEFFDCRGSNVSLTSIKRFSTRW